MPEKQNHIIYSSSVELEFYNKKEDLFIQNRIANLVKDRLMPAIESLFDEQTLSGKKIKINALELNLGEIQYTAWDDEFVNRTIYHLRQKLNEIVAFTSAEEVYQVNYTDDKVNISTMPALDECLDNFKFFLLSGLLRWNVGQVTAADLLDEILKAHSSRELTSVQKEKLLQSVFNSATVFERFILQFDHTRQVYFFEKILNFSEASTLLRFFKPSVSEAFLETTIPAYRHEYLSWLFVLLQFQKENKALMPSAAQIMSWIKKDISASSLDAVLAGLTQDSGLKQFFSDESVSTQTGAKYMSKSEKAEDHPSTIKKTPEDFMEYFIDNAGLVILSPFLQQLFTNLGLSRKKQFRSEEHQVRAVLLSQFLVTDKTQIAEHELPLNKILCGYELEKTLPGAFEPTEEETQQCTELLQSVIEYWKELKTTSSEALRNTYIIRNGKLINMDDYWLLQVEYNAFDVMLQFLPWSIGVIYLPWMKKRLMVEWHS